MSIGWNTYDRVSKPCVAYGTSEDNLSDKVCSTLSQTYPTSRTWFNFVTLDDLEPATTYFYKIVSPNSTVERFFSPRTPGDKTPFSINAVVDLGVYGEDGFTIEDDLTKRDLIPNIPPSLNHTTIQRLADTVDDYEFIIHPGDFAYADNWRDRKHNRGDGENAFQAILEQFYDQLAPIAARKPYMTSPGNHEAACVETPCRTGDCPNGQKNFTDFMSRFAEGMPTAFASTSLDSQAKVNANKAKMLANPPFWYSFEYGMAHVVMFNTETDFANAPDTQQGFAHLGAGPFGYPDQQMQFLESDLASVDRTVTPWLIVAGHRPWYTSGSAACHPCQAAFEPILYKYGVDLAVFGHVHNSQRILPVYNDVEDPAGMEDPKAPMYVVAGGPGNIEGTAKLGKSRPFTAFGYDEDFSYASFKVADENHLEISFFKSSSGELLDHSTLYKSHKDQFVVHEPPAKKSATKK
jgi:hypothetical protein